MPEFGRAKSIVGYRRISVKTPKCRQSVLHPSPQLAHCRGQAMCMAPPLNSLHSRAHTIPAGRPLVLVHMGKKEKEKVPQVFPLLPNGCTETSTPFGCGKRRSGSTCCLFLFFPCCPTSRAEKPTPPSDVGQVGVKEYSLPFVPLLSCSVKVQ